MSLFLPSDEGRAILALSFEPSADGYFYYYWRWSRGIPVTAEEREAYLKIPSLGSRRAWRKGIANRSTVPPRAFGPTHQKLLVAMPVSMAVLGLLGGLIFALSGASDILSIGGVASLIAGVALIWFGCWIILAKIRHTRKGVALPPQ
ncbi:hypothetical protein G4G27_00380 [Sphingomonas sp. So64.6b]|uniref:hypothetical protein n=1 Tax=Sphingomonas sp. So64.6b TaxID=2997354 RepID=UPI001603304C|nr:hypothetical protein [Sphingomonas sp. So64.6b]QNA82632.1 hypothetical protein G4G27_00380 [Sphingomonas sp. So64.6b]